MDLLLLLNQCNNVLFKTNIPYTVKIQATNPELIVLPANSSLNHL
jgi:hypothetical protein